MFPSFVAVEPVFRNQHHKRDKTLFRLLWATSNIIKSGLYHGPNLAHFLFFADSSYLTGKKFSFITENDIIIHCKTCLIFRIVFIWGAEATEVDGKSEIPILFPGSTSILFRFPRFDLDPSPERIF